MLPDLTEKRLVKIVARVQRWIKAEWAFRLGPYAYGDKTTERYVRAERRLRAALTGKANLGEAAKLLGFSHTSALGKRKSK